MGSFVVVLRSVVVETQGAVVFIACLATTVYWAKMVESAAVAEVLDDRIGKGHLGGRVYLHSNITGSPNMEKGGFLSAEGRKILQPTQQSAPG